MCPEEQTKSNLVRSQMKTLGVCFFAGWSALS